MSLATATPPGDVDDLRDFSVNRIIADAIRRGQGSPVPVTASIPRSAPLRRDMTTSTASGVIGEGIASWSDAVRQRSLLSRLGAVTIGGTIDRVDTPRKVRIPRWTATTSARWLSENGSDTESSPTATGELVGLLRVSAYAEISRVVAVNSGASNSGALDALVRELAAGVAYAIDAGFLAGDGEDDAPLGILNRPDATLIAMGTDGAALDWDGVLDAQKTLADIGHEPTDLAWVLSPATRRALQGTPKITGQASYICNDDGRIGEIRSFAHNGLPDDGVKGDGEDLGSAVIGAWDQMLIVDWGSDLIINPYSLDTSGMIRVSVVHHINYGLRSPESFQVIRDIVTS